MHKWEAVKSLYPMVMCKCGYYRVEVRDLSATTKKLAEEAGCKVYAYSHVYFGKVGKTETGIKLPTTANEHSNLCNYHG